MEPKRIYSVYALKAAYEEKHPNGYFFSPNTLDFFGETLSHMKVERKTKEVIDWYGKKHTCYVLKHRQKPPFSDYIWAESYFDVETMDYIPKR